MYTELHTVLLLQHYSATVQYNTLHFGTVHGIVFLKHLPVRAVQYSTVQ